MKLSLRIGERKAMRLASVSFATFCFICVLLYNWLRYPFYYNLPCPNTSSMWLFNICCSCNLSCYLLNLFPVHIPYMILAHRYLKHISTSFYNMHPVYCIQDLYPRLPGISFLFFLPWFPCWICFLLGSSDNPTVSFPNSGRRW